MKVARAGLGLGAAILVALSTRGAVCVASGSEQDSLKTSGRMVTYEVLGEESGAQIVILLHGASGLKLPLYREQSELLAKSGYTVLLLHYFEAAEDSKPSPANYRVWSKAVADLVEECHRNPRFKDRRVAVVGYSLGASVALAAGSQKLAVAGVVDWYGSLPDEFFYRFAGMPPLLILHGEQDKTIPVQNALQLIRLCSMNGLVCEHQIYPNASHGFVGATLSEADDRMLSFLSKTLHGTSGN